MQRDVLVQKVEVLEGEQEMLKGSLFQASLPVVGTLVGLGIARWRLKVHKRRLQELQTREQLDETPEEQQARWAREDEAGHPKTSTDAVPDAPDAA